MWLDHEDSDQINDCYLDGVILRGYYQEVGPTLRITRVCPEKIHLGTTPCLSLLPGHHVLSNPVPPCPLCHDSPEPWSQPETPKARRWNKHSLLHSFSYRYLAHWWKSNLTWWLSQESASGFWQCSPSSPHWCIVNFLLESKEEAQLPHSQRFNAPSWDSV